MADEILQPNKPTTFQAWAPYPKFRKLKAGEVFTVQFTVEEHVWAQLRTIPEANICEIVLWHHDGDGPGVQTVLAPEPVEIEAKPNGKPKKEPGPYAQFWRLMVVKGVKTYPDLQEALDTTPDRVWEALHAAFETDTMSTVSPRVWETWVKEKGLSDGLISMSRNAERESI